MDLDCGHADEEFGRYVRIRLAAGKQTDDINFTPAQGGRGSRVRRRFDRIRVDGRD